MAVATFDNRGNDPFRVVGSGCRRYQLKKKTGYEKNNMGASRDNPYSSWLMGISPNSRGIFSPLPVPSAIAGIWDYERSRFKAVPGSL